MNYRNAKRLADSRIDCEIDHPLHGWIPFTLDLRDAGAGFDVAEIYAQIDADPATMAYAPPTEQEKASAKEAARATMSITFAQLLIGLVSEGWITEAEGEAWLEGRLPAQVLALIATLPPQQRFVAKARASRPSEVLRSDPLVGLLAAVQGKTDDDIDAFFSKYGSV